MAWVRFPQIAALGTSIGRSLRHSDMISGVYAPKRGDAAR